MHNPVFHAIVFPGVKVDQDLLGILHPQIVLTKRETEVTERVSVKFQLHTHLKTRGALTLKGSEDKPGLQE